MLDLVWRQDMRGPRARDRQTWHVSRRRAEGVCVQEDRRLVHKRRLVPVRLQMRAYYQPLLFLDLGLVIRGSSGFILLYTFKVRTRVRLEINRPLL